eukprot:g15763.t1
MARVPQQSHLHYGVAKATGIQEFGPEGFSVELKADEMSGKREAFNAARAEVSSTIQAKRTIALPTQDPAVRAKLREYGLPITLFGEGAYERRERLRGVMTGDKRTETGRVAKIEDEQQELFFTLGPEKLKQKRLEIAKFSLASALTRLTAERSEERDEVENESWCLDKIRDGAGIELSQVGDERPLTQGTFSPDGKVLGTASWTGYVKLWSVPSGKHIKTLRSSIETRAHGICFAPILHSGGGGDTMGESTAMEVDGEPPSLARQYVMASAMANGNVCLWSSKQETPVAVLKGHEERVNRVAFHPNGSLVASTSHDQTWRLWDVETRTELLCQEGHSSGVYGLAIHPDGSLICTTDLGGIARIWDLRTGRTVLPLQGHSDQLLTCDFNPRGFQLATAGADHSIKFWDLRKRKCVATLQAHNKTISEVQYDKTGRYFISSSYDKTVKAWNADNRHCVKVLIGHEARIMGASCCAAEDGVGRERHWIASVAFDRTFKLWKTAL